MIDNTFLITIILAAMYGKFWLETSWVRSDFFNRGIEMEWYKNAVCQVKTLIEFTTLIASFTSYQA